MTSFRIRTGLLATLALAAAAGAASAGDVKTLDLGPLTHGRIVNGLDLGGVTVSADNYHAPDQNDLAVVFDTRRRRTRDRDLEGPDARGRGGWSAGNLQGQTVGNILIIQEHDVLAQRNGVVLRPDDEGRRPAGDLFFRFTQAIDSFSFALIDVEGTEEFSRGSGFFATFFGPNGSVRVAFRDLLDNTNRFYDPTVTFGDNSANQVSPITAALLGLESFNGVQINLGGSGGVGNVRYTTAVPTPSAAAAGLLLLAGAAARRRRAAG